MHESIAHVESYDVVNVKHSKSVHGRVCAAQIRLIRFPLNLFLYSSLRDATTFSEIEKMSLENARD